MCTARAAKLSIFPHEIEARGRIARRFNTALGQNEAIRVPQLMAGARSVWAQYTIQVDGDRAKLQSDLKDHGIPSRIYYPAPLPQQAAYAGYPSVPVPAAIRLAGEVLSLPMHPYLSELDQQRIIDGVLRSLA